MYNELPDVSINDENNLVDDISLLKEIKLKNVNRLVIGHLNINSLPGKFEPLKDFIRNYIDILIITESKIDASFPGQQSFIDGFSMPFRLDRNINGGGVLAYVRDDIPCTQLSSHTYDKDLEGLFFEINLRKNKWLVFGGYNNTKNNIGVFLGKLGSKLDQYMPKYDNLLVLGDFNSEIQVNFVMYTTYEI